MKLKPQDPLNASVSVFRIRRELLFARIALLELSGKLSAEKAKSLRERLR